MTGNNKSLYHCYLRMRYPTNDSRKSLSLPPLIAAVGAFEASFYFREWRSNASSSEDHSVDNNPLMFTVCMYHSGVVGSALQSRSLFFLSPTKDSQQPEALWSSAAVGRINQDFSLITASPEQTYWLIRLPSEKVRPSHCRNSDAVTHSIREHTHTHTHTHI